MNFGSSPNSMENTYKENHIYAHHHKTARNKAKKNKNATFKGITIKLTDDFLIEMKEARIQWNIFKGLNKKKRQARILYPVKISSKYKSVQTKTERIVTPADTFHYTH